MECRCTGFVKNGALLNSRSIFGANVSGNSARCDSRWCRHVRSGSSVRLSRIGNWCWRRASDCASARVDPPTLSMVLEVLRA